jgi:hypothetical protein
MELLSEGAQCGGPLLRASLMGTLEVPDMGVSLHKGPLTCEGKLESRAGSYTRDFE